MEAGGNLERCFLSIWIHARFHPMMWANPLSALKIRVSVVRFRPWPPFKIKVLVENDTDVKCPIFIGHSVIVFKPIQATDHSRPEAVLPLQKPGSYKRTLRGLAATSVRIATRPIRGAVPQPRPYRNPRRCLKHMRLMKPSTLGRASLFTLRPSPS